MTSATQTLSLLWAPVSTDYLKFLLISVMRNWKFIKKINNFFLIYLSAHCKEKMVVDHAN